MSDSLHLLTGAYAVNALDPAERAEFEAHLATCPDCAAEVRGLLDTTARLGSAEAVEPPARLKAAVLAQIAQTRQLPPVVDDDAGRDAPDSAVATGGDAAAAVEFGDALVVPLRRPGWTLAQRALAAAAAILAVVAIGLSALLAHTASAKQQVDARQAAVTRVLTAPDARSLAGAVEGGGRATLVYSASQGTSVFVAADLPAAPSGHTYELWYLTSSGSAVPAGTFDPAADGQATRVLTGSLSSASGVAMTVEPAGGSPKPTTKPVMAVSLA
jgi:anti-sigma-K factor RskA